MPQSIDCSAQPLDLAFHPTNENLVAVGLVDGTLEVHSLPIDNGGEKKDDDSENDTILASIPIYNVEGAASFISENGDHPNSVLPACRATLFSNDGQQVYVGGSDVCALDAERINSLGADESTILWRIPSTTAVHCLKQLPVSAPAGPLLCCGSDIGGIRLWDTRLCSSTSNLKKACVMEWNDNEDYISGFDFNPDGTTLLASSADCTLSVLDLRMALNPQTKSEAFRQSDNQEDELLSIQILKNGRKVLCGTQQGVLAVWSWGTWGDVSDRFPGHPASIDALLKVDEDTVLTGSSDGLIRLVQLHPDKLLGVLGDHDGYPIEKLQFNADRSFVGSVSHDNFIRLWNARLLQDDYEGDDDDEELEIADQKVGVATMLTTTKHDSDDDWSDDDDEDMQASEEDSDDSNAEDEEETANDRRSKRLKSDNEKFFEDL